MNVDMLITLVILFIAIVFFITEWLRADVVALGVVLALMLTDIISIEAGIAGFSNKAVVSIGALFVVGGAVFHTGLANVFAAQIIRIAGGDEKRLLLVLMIAVSFAGSFISSTGIVALLLPAMMSLSNRLNIPPSRLLLPVSYSALLGGTVTLIATPPNVIASDALIAAGYEGFSFFSFTPLGVALVIGGIIYMMLFGEKLLPSRVVESDVQKIETPEQLFDIYNLPDRMFRIQITADSKLAGLTVSDARLRSDYGLNIIRLMRRSSGNNGGFGIGKREIISHIEPDMVFNVGDVLIVQGDVQAVQKASEALDTDFMATETVGQKDIITSEIGIAEIMLRPRSELLGKTIREVNFAASYHVTVIAIKRHNSEIINDVKDVTLRLGDMMIVQGAWGDIFAMKKRRHDFVVMGEPEAEQFGAFSRTTRAPVVMGLLILMIGLIALNIMELTTASMLVAVLMVLTGCLTMDEAYRSIDWKSIMVIAGILPMSTAMAQVGIIDIVSETIVTTLGGFGPVAVLAGLFMLSLMFTLVLSNTATALLLMPVALFTANAMDVQPHAFVMAVAVAASMAFISPISTPVTALVMTPGNYKFFDFVKIGVPMAIITMIISIIVLPLVWGF
jgi:di/tricarboxylate transporter